MVSQIFFHSSQLEKRRNREEEEEESKEMNERKTTLPRGGKILQDKKKKEPNLSLLFFSSDRGLNPVTSTARRIRLLFILKYLQRGPRGKSSFNTRGLPHVGDISPISVPNFSRPSSPSLIFCPIPIPIPIHIPLRPHSYSSNSIKPVRTDDSSA